ALADPSFSTLRMGPSPVSRKPRRRFPTDSGHYFAFISRPRRPSRFYNLCLANGSSPGKVCAGAANRLDWRRGWPPVRTNPMLGFRGPNPHIPCPLSRLHGIATRKATRMDFLKPRSHRMNRRRRIYEGKAKVLYEGPEPGTLIQYFKDAATAFNAKKHEVIEGKGVLNNRISEYVFQRLNDIGVPTHFIRRLNMREQLIREVEIIPLEVVVRNIAAGSLSTRLGLEEGTQ